jgi:predicted PurR-regulated permease PerM
LNLQYYKSIHVLTNQYKDFYILISALPAILWTDYLLVPMLVIFVGVIGGFILSGFIGLFTGAIVISIGYKKLVAWIDDSNPQAEELKTEQAG